VTVVIEKGTVQYEGKAMEAQVAKITARMKQSR
jgi:hypothetical protein